VRYLNSVTEKKFIKYSSVLYSLKKVFNNKNSYSRSREIDDPKKVYLCVAVLVVALMLAEIGYCLLLLGSDFLFARDGEGYLVSSIFWANFALPFLVEHFYLGELSMHPTNLKVRIFPFIVGGFLLETLLEGWLLPAMTLAKLAVVYTYCKQGYDMFHLRQLIRLTLLALVIFYAIVKFEVMEAGSLLSWQVIGSAWSVLWSAVVIAAAMLLTRLVALIFLKQELSKYFYTEMHLQLGFVLGTMLMSASYINFASSNTPIQIHSYISLIFLSIVGALVYL
jgi:hypothetical protein